MRGASVKGVLLVVAVAGGCTALGWALGQALGRAMVEGPRDLPTIYMQQEAPR